MKYTDKIQAITTLRQLKHQFDDLGVAKCCLKDDVKQVVISQWTDGTFSVRFKNVGPEGDIFRRQELYQVYNNCVHYILTIPFLAGQFVCNNKPR